MFGIRVWNNTVEFHEEETYIFMIITHRPPSPIMQFQNTIPSRSKAFQNCCQVRLLPNQRPTGCLPAEKTLELLSYLAGLSVIGQNFGPAWIQNERKPTTSN